MYRSDGQYLDVSIMSLTPQTVFFLKPVPAAMKLHSEVGNDLPMTG